MEKLARQILTTATVQNQGNKVGEPGRNGKKIRSLITNNKTHKLNPLIKSFLSSVQSFFAVIKFSKELASLIGTKISNDKTTGKKI